MGDRLAVVPVELMFAGRSMLQTAACLCILAGLALDGFSWARVGTVGLGAAASPHLVVVGCHPLLTLDGLPA